MRIADAVEKVRAGAIATNAIFARIGKVAEPPPKPPTTKERLLQFHRDHVEGFEEDQFTFVQGRWQHLPTKPRAVREVVELRPVSTEPPLKGGYKFTAGGGEREGGVGGGIGKRKPILTLDGAGDEIDRSPSQRLAAAEAAAAEAATLERDEKRKDREAVDGEPESTQSVVRRLPKPVLRASRTTRDVLFEKTRAKRTPPPPLLLLSLGPVSLGLVSFCPSQPWPSQLLPKSALAQSALAQSALAQSALARSRPESPLPSNTRVRLCSHRVRHGPVPVPLLLHTHRPSCSDRPLHLRWRRNRRSAECTGAISPASASPVPSPAPIASALSAGALTSTPLTLTLALPSTTAAVAATFAPSRAATAVAATVSNAAITQATATPLALTFARASSLAIAKPKPAAATLATGPGRVFGACPCQLASYAELGLRVGSR